MTNTNTLGSLATPIQRPGYGLPMTPVKNRVVIKHDAVTGKVALLYNNDVDENKSVEVKQVGFIPLTIPHHLVHSEKDTTKRIDTSLSYSYIFDLYQYNSSHRSFGLKTPTEAYEELDTRDVYRVFGFIISINGESINESKSEIVQAYNGQLIPCFIDLKYKKFNKLLDAGRLAGVDYNGRPIVEGNSVTLTSNNSDAVRYPDDKYYYPDFKVDKLEGKNQEGLRKYAQNYLSVLKDYIDKIKKNDEFLEKLYIEGLTKPGTVNTLRELGITDIDSLERTIETYGNNPIERFAQLRKMVDERLGHVQNNNNVEVKVEQATPQLSPELLSLIQQQIGQQKAAVGDVNNFNNAQQNVMNQTNNNGMSFPWS